MIRLEDYKREFIYIFFAQKKLILRTTLIIAVISVCIALFWPSTYVATGKVLLRGKKLQSGPEVLQNTEMRSLPIVTEDLLSEIEILISYDVARMTVEELQGKSISEIHDETELAKMYEDIAEIKKNLSTQIIPGSNVIAISLYNRDPNRAVHLLDQLMNQYVSFRVGVFSPIQEQDFLQQQLKKFEKALHDKRQEIIALVEKSKSSQPEKEIETNISTKKDLQDQLNQLKTDAIEKGITIRYLDEQLNNADFSPFLFIDNKLITDHNEKLLELYAEKGKILRNYQPASANAQLIETQIQEEFEQLKREIAAYRANLNNELAIIDAQIDDIVEKMHSNDQRNIRLQEQLLTMQKLNSEIALIQNSHDAIYRHSEEAKINSNMSAGNIPLYISILSRASAPDKPAFPVPSIIIPLGLIIGFITGCSFGFIKEYFDHTFKKPSDVVNYAELPVIFSVPVLNIEK